MSQLISDIQNYLNELQNSHRLRALKTITSDQGALITYSQKEYINFSSNNYLGLANHPDLANASVEAIKKFGTGSGASRLITGSMSLHEQLEADLASFKGTENCLVFNSGYQANIGLIASLMSEGDFIYSDSLNHASLIDGCRLSKATTTIYAHGDVTQLKAQLKRNSAATRKLIITDSVFSMDGDLAPLPELVNLCEQYDAYLFIDEAHATGIFGVNGSGLLEHFKISPRHERVIQMGTLGKALGSFGAYIACTHALKSFLINTARSFIFTTSLPPAVLAASIAAINCVKKYPNLRSNLWQNIAYVQDKLPPLLTKNNYKIDPIASPIIPIIIGSNELTMELAQKLFERGLWVTGIRPPTVPVGTSRLRITIMATHTQKQLDQLLSFFA